MQYSRAGIPYGMYKKAERVSSKEAKSSIDIINILLFILLGIVIVLFIVT